LKKQLQQSEHKLTEKRIRSTLNERHLGFIGVDWNRRTWKWRAKCDRHGDSRWRRQ